MIVISKSHFNYLVLARTAAVYDYYLVIVPNSRRPLLFIVKLAVINRFTVSRWKYKFSDKLIKVYSTFKSTENEYEADSGICTILIKEKLTYTNIMCLHLNTLQIWNKLCRHYSSAFIPILDNIITNLSGSYRSTIRHLLVSSLASFGVSIFLVSCSKPL